MSKQRENSDVRVSTRKLHKVHETRIVDKVEIIFKATWFKWCLNTACEWAEIRSDDSLFHRVTTLGKEWRWADVFVIGWYNAIYTVMEPGRRVGVRSEYWGWYHWTTKQNTFAQVQQQLLTFRHVARGSQFIIWMGSWQSGNQRPVAKLCSKSLYTLKLVEIGSVVGVPHTGTVIQQEQKSGFVQPGQGFPASRVKTLVEQAQLFPGLGTSVVYVCRPRQVWGNSDSKVFQGGGLSNVTACHSDFGWQTV